VDTKKLTAYYDLTKPGIIYANVLTAIAGYLFGSSWHIRLGVLAGVICGIALVIGGACVYNNILDRNFDSRMERTKKRALVTGAISVPAAFTYATVLVAGGFLFLGFLTNLTVVIIGLVGIVDYIILYGWAKRHTPLSTIVGSISGSTSIVAGYCAATNHIGVDAVLLFLILTLWQMPHFYAIALYRKSDYSAIDVPLMPIVRSGETAKLRIMAYIVALLLAVVALTVWGTANVICLVVLVVLTGWWLQVGIKNYRLNSVSWGKKMFLFSLVVNIGLSLAISFGSVSL
jgi:protoheme IX farnesyltransferase